MMNDVALKLLDEVSEQIKQAEHPVEILVLTRVGGDYHRYSTGVEDLRALVGALEIAKYDALRRMTQ
jgi:hypothetical protein